MNDDNSEPQPWIDPALEARLVAHVLGETSAFEAAELERLLAENPELALFKRRIEAVHSLAASAAKPDSPKLQLHADKRQKLLDIIGRTPAAATSKRIFVMPNAPWWKSEALLRIAVCLVMIALVLGIFSIFSLDKPTSTASQFEGERGAFTLNEGPIVSLPQGAAAGQAQPSIGASYGDQGFVVFRKGGEGAILQDEDRLAARLPQSVTMPTTPTAFETVPQEKIASFSNSWSAAPTTTAPAAPQVSMAPSQAGAMSYMGGGNIDRDDGRSDQVDKSKLLATGAVTSTASPKQSARRYIADFTANTMEADRPIAKDSTAGDTKTEEDKVPLLGDIPIAGRLFRSRESIATGGAATTGPSECADRNERTGAQLEGMAMAAQNQAASAETIDQATFGKFEGSLRSNYQTNGSATKLPETRGSDQEALDRLSKRAEAIAISQADETVSWDGKSYHDPRQEFTALDKKEENVSMQEREGAERNPVGNWDSVYMYRGVNVSEREQSIDSDKASSGSVTAGSRSASTTISANSVDALLFGVTPPDEAEKAKAAKDNALSAQPTGSLVSENVINQPVFSSRDGKAEFDGFVNYGSPITTVVTTQTEQQKAETEKLVKEGKEFAENGRYDLAHKRYEQALTADPYNIEGRRGMEQVNQAREKYAATASNEARGSMTAQVAQTWELPVRKFDIGATTITANPEIDQRGTALINRKLNEIVIPRIDFENVTVREALDFLKQRAAQLDTDEKGADKRGVNILLNIPEAAPEAGARINLGLTDIPLRAAIDYVAKAANLKLKVEPYAASVVLQSTPTDVLITKEYKVPPGFITALPGSRSSGTLHAGAGGTAAASSLPAIAARSGAKEFLENSGVTFPPGAVAYYLPNSNKLIVKNTQANLDLIDAVTDIPAPVAPKPIVRGNEISASEQAFSTFSLHVSDVSFQLAKDALARGSRPEPDRIRTEEFYNAFDYNDPAPATGEEVTCRIESCAHPYLQQRDLVRLAVKVAAAGRAAGQPLRLTILLDTSGSMEREDRAESVRRALKSLVTLLGPQDRVTLIGFARTPRLLAEDVPGDQVEKLVDIAARTPSEGGTNLEEALSLASKMALKSKLAGAQNRIVLLTDGAANLGDANPERLARQIESTRQQGISFDACGVGAKGLNDSILEALTRKGDGRYYYLNSPEDADAGFARQLAGAFRPAAENVKVQVVFNPARVSRYRLLGFEKHLLKKQDFRNDKVQAAELSAEEAGVALYQIETLPEGSGEVGEVFVRFRDPAKGTMVERSWTMPYVAKASSFDQASPSLQLATVSALLAEKLRGDEQVDLDALVPAIPILRQSYSGQQRVAELIQMFETLRR